VDQLSLAVGQSALLEHARQKAQREATTNQINYLLHVLPASELKAALEETVKAFGGIGGRLFIRENAFDGKLGQSQGNDRPIERLYDYGCQPILHERAQPRQIEDYHGWQAHFQVADEHPWPGFYGEPVDGPASRVELCAPWAIADIDQVSDLRTLQSAFRAAKIRSVLIVPLQARQQTIGYLSVFRAEVTTETLWAGAFDPDHRQEFPRQSFDVWRQTKTGQSQPWTEADVDWAKTIGQYFATALEKTILQHRIQAFNATLERQVEQRTTELQDTLRHLQETQAHLIQAEKMSSLGQLVAGIAHEINNPVNFIHGNLLHVHTYVEELLNLVQCYQRTPLPTEEITALLEALDLEFVREDLPKTLGSMRLGTERIREIVLSLRNFSRLDESEIKDVDIHAGIDSTLMILQHRLKVSGHRPAIQLTKDYGSLPPVECYAGSLNQVFMNLISNAMDAIDAVVDSGERATRGPDWVPAITIRTEVLPVGADADGGGDPSNIAQPATHVLITILDNGQGMTEQTRQKLFNPFFTTKPVGKGTGLGLSISYQIVTERHGGTLTCDSTRHQGSKFQVKIPLLKG
jgi:signal transduction histidine kinase